MDGRRSSPRRTSRLLLRVCAAENLRHVSSQGTYCKIYVDECEMTRGSHTKMGGTGARSSLKRLLHHSSNNNQRHGGGTLDDAARMRNSMDTMDDFSPRIYKTKAQKSLRGNPEWKETFEIPVFDAINEVLTIRIKTARLMSAPSIGAGIVALRELSEDATWDRWINLLDSSKRPAGRLRIQLRLLSHGSTRRENDEDDDMEDEKLEPRIMSSSPIPRAMRRGAIIAPPIGGAGILRRSSTLSRSLIESRTSSSTAASDSVSSEYSSGSRLSVPNVTVSPYPHTNHDSDLSSPESPIPRTASHRTLAPRASARNTSSSIQRDTAFSLASRGTEELDMLASKYMTRSNARAASNRVPSEPQAPAMLSLSERKLSTAMEAPTLAGTTPESPESPRSTMKLSAETKDLKDDRSPRTTNTTAVSSDDEDPNDAATVEFDFDTGDVRPSTRLPAHMMRSTVTRSSIATSRIESDNEQSESDDDDDDDNEDEPEDDEMDPDADAEGPRVFLRSTVTALLRRDSVNVIMDEDEQDEDDDDGMFDPEKDGFVFDELPILDIADTILLLDEIDCCADGDASHP